MRHGATFAVFVLISVPAAAQEQDSHGLVLTTGLKVAVIDDSGEKVEGRVEDVSARSLRIARSGGIAEIDPSSIVRIERPDGLGDGALRGFAVGFGLVVVQAALQEPGTDIHRGWVFAIALGQGGMGAGIGVGLDALFDNHEILYERGRRVTTRLTPLVGGGKRGAALSVSW